MLKDISNFNDTNDYLPIILAALIVDMIILLQIVFRQINFKSLNNWYNKFQLLAVVADVLSIVIGIIISRFLYKYIFNEYSLIKFIILTCIIQLLHDLLFYKFFTSIPRNNSLILDIFKDYSIEVGKKILLADSLMIIFTIIFASYFSTLKLNSNIIILIISLYILPYLLYSIK